MNYGAIKTVDIADDPGVRVSLFVSGCRNHCRGCFQPETCLSQKDGALFLTELMHRCRVDCEV